MPCLEMSGIVKRFGGITALRAASLSVEAGEIHGLVAEDGAGKSTLISIASGVLRPDDGSIRLQNAPVHFANPRQAAAVANRDSSLIELTERRHGLAHIRHGIRSVRETRRSRLS